MSNITVSKRGKGKEKKWKWQLKIYLPETKKFFYETIEADRKEDARAIADEKLKLNQPMKVKSDSVSSQAIEDFITADLTSDDAAPNTVERYVGTVRTFFGRFLPEKHSEITKMSAITSDVFGDYKDYIVLVGRTKGWSAEIRILKPIFSRLLRRNRCTEDVYKELKKFKSPKQVRKEGIILNKTEKKLLCNAIKSDRLDYWGITYFILRNAWRIDEVCKILKDNIKTNGFKPIEIVSKVVDRKIKYDFHFKAFDDDLTNVVKQFLYNDRKIYLFANSNNKKHNYRHYEEYLAKVSQQVLGKRLTPTDLRKTCITELVASGATPNDIMAITGHRDYETVISFYSSSTVEGTTKGLEATRF